MVIFQYTSVLADFLFRDPAGTVTLRDAGGVIRSKTNFVVWATFFLRESDYSGLKPRTK